MSKINATSPVGRLVGGSLYKPNDKDADGNQLVFKHGPNAGKPRIDYYFALAIPKGAEVSHGAFGWMATPWGAQIRQVAEAFMAHATQLPTFAWKVTDGDSQVPNKKGKKPCDADGYKGHWILRFSGGYPPSIYTLCGQPPGSQPAPLAGEDAINLGDYVQVNFDCDDNGSQQQPGVYLNHRMVCLIGYGTRIVLGPDVASAGFGGAMPAGASTTPPAGFTPPVQGALPLTPAPAVPASPPVPPSVPTSGAPLPPPPVPPVPPANPAILQVQPPAKVMTPAAQQQGFTYAALQTAGWSDAQMVQAGYLAP